MFPMVGMKSGKTETSLLRNSYLTPNKFMTLPTELGVVMSFLVVVTCETNIA